MIYKIVEYSSYILDIFLPRACFYCNKLSRSICDSCIKKRLTPKKVQLCPYKNIISTHGKSKARKYLNGLFVAYKYDLNPDLRKIIKSQKYFSAFDNSLLLGRLLKEAMKNDNFDYSSYTVTYVPFDSRSFLDRFFNHSYLIAMSLSTPVKLLRKVKYTKPQVKLNRQDRKNNLKDVFQVIKKDVPNKVLIVDDVASTLATLEECAKVLKKAGVKEVFAAVLARN